MSKAQRKFKDRLAAKTHIAGWSANGWAAHTEPDRVATRIANRYTREFTAAMRKMGAMPFTGVELNFYPVGENDTAMVRYIKEQSERYRNRYLQRTEGRKIIYPLARTPFFMQEPESLSVMNRGQIIQGLLKKLVAQGFLDRPDIDQLSLNYDEHVSACLFPEAAELVDRYIEFTREIKRNPVKGAASLIAGSEPNAQHEEFRGRIYRDTSHEVEIATPPASPMSTVAHVNALKKIGYEATDEYSQLYKAHRKKLSDREVPRSDVARAMRNHLSPFNLSFGDAKENSGEHLNVSMLLTRGRGYVDIHRAQQDDTAMHLFATDNLFSNPYLRRLFLKAYADYLPDSFLLALGYGDPLSRHGGKRPFMKDKGPEGFESCPPYASRIELRSFHDATSNISLTMMAVMAVNYMVMREIMNDPLGAQKINDHNFHEFHQVDSDRIYEALQKRYEAEPHLSTNIKNAKERFTEHSAVLKIMRELATENAATPEEASERMYEILEFEKAVCARADRLAPTRGNHH